MNLAEWVEQHAAGATGAAHKRRAGTATRRKGRGATHDALMRPAKDFDEIGVDLELGAVEIRHPELLPQ